MYRDDNDNQQRKSNVGRAAQGIKWASRLRKLIKGVKGVGTAVKAGITAIAGWKIIAIILLVILILYLFFMLIVGIIYYAAPSGGVYSTSAQPTVKDDALQSYYIDIASKNIYRDRWLVESGSSQMMNEVISTDIIVEDLRSSVFNSPTAAELIGLIDNEPENPQPFWPAMRIKVAGINVSANNPYVQYFSLADINLDGTKITQNGTGKLGDLDLKTPSGMTAAELDVKLSGTMMAGLGQAFKDAETKYGVNAVFLCALAIHESAWGSSQIARAKNNLFGWGANDEDPGNMAKTFDSYADSVDRVASKIKDWYLTPGGQFYTDPTITGVNTIYCSTPTWSDGVGSLMLELGSVDIPSDAVASTSSTIDTGQIAPSTSTVSTNKTKVPADGYFRLSQAQQVFLTFKEDDPRPYLQENNYYKDITTLVDCGDIPSGVTHNTDYYAATGKNLEDRYGQEYDDKNNIAIETWGMVHTATLYYCVTNMLDDTTAHFKEQCGNAFKPLLYYKPSTITTVTVNDKGESETYVENILLLTEADTIRGHYRYSYKWKTESYPNGGSKTFEEPLGPTLVSKTEWERLDKWIEEVLDPVEEQKRIVREMMIQAAIGYDAVDQNIPWLLEPLTEDKKGNLAAVSIPELASYKNAQEATGIPFWFLLGLAQHLSGLDTGFVDKATKASGLMQIRPEERERLLNIILSTYSDGLPSETLELIKATPEPQRDDMFYENLFKNSTVNVLAGSVLLIEQGFDPYAVTWTDEDSWKTATADVLVKYLAIGSVPKSEWSNYGITSEAQANDSAKVKEYVMATQVSQIQEYAEKYQSSGLQQPLSPGHEMTSPWGMRMHPTLGVYKLHTGVDFGASTGEPIYAATTGVVTVAGWRGGYGNCVMIYNGEATFLCAHMSEILVQENASTNAGDTIGLVGSTGYSTGAHLHFGVFPGLYDENNSVDPVQYYSERGVTLFW